uniref:Uncharacterized protein n=1 Tax=Kalanchoe fedtschenkoi TaxID=63787 RepID=A0A7N0TBM3_KALFE
MASLVLMKRIYEGKLENLSLSELISTNARLMKKRTELERGLVLKINWCWSFNLYN